MQTYFFCKIYKYLSIYEDTFEQRYLEMIVH